MVVQVFNIIQETNVGAKYIYFMILVSYITGIKRGGHGGLLVCGHGTSIGCKIGLAGGNNII